MINQINSRHTIYPLKSNLPPPFYYFLSFLFLPSFIAPIRANAKHPTIKIKIKKEMGFMFSNSKQSGFAETQINMKNSKA